MSTLFTTLGLSAKSSSEILIGRWDTFKSLGLPPLPKERGEKKSPSWGLHKAKRTASAKPAKPRGKHFKWGERPAKKGRSYASSCSRGRGDEFYTRYEDVEALMEQYLPLLRDKKVLCPCGGDNGSWARYLRSHGVRNITTDPLLDYDSFDFADYDYVISNPPFSLTKDFLAKIDEAGCGGLVVIPDVSLANSASISLLNKGWRSYDEGAPRTFNRPDGTQRKVNCSVITSFQTNVYEGTKRRRVGHNAPVMTEQGIVRYKHTADVPQRWSGVIAVPIGFVNIRFDHRIHTLSPKQVSLTVAGKDKGEFASFLVSCDGSTVVKENGEIVRYSKAGNRVCLTPKATALLA